MSQLQIRLPNIDLRLSAFLILTLAACTTPRSSTLGPNLSEIQGSRLSDQSIWREVDAAQGMMDDGEFHAVIPRLQYAISKYPVTKPTLDARYMLGVSYYQISAYRESILALNDYLRLSPEGPHAAECAEMVDRLENELERQFPTTSALDEEIALLERSLSEQPSSAELGVQLAEKLWTRGDYERSGALYWELQRAHPEFSNSDHIRTRIEALPEGGYVVLDPDEVERRAVTKEPIAVFGVNAFKAGRDILSAVPRYYVVTGQVVNRSDKVVNSVEILTTIYGFGDVVYDTNTSRIGRMAPGDVRAFNVRFTSFPNINRINRYKCVVNFQR